MKNKLKRFLKKFYNEFLPSTSFIFALGGIAVFYYGIIGVGQVFFKLNPEYLNPSRYLFFGLVIWYLSKEIFSISIKTRIK